MRRRLLSLCLALCMVLGMLPVVTMAAETQQYTVIAGDRSYSASYVGTGGDSMGESGDVYAVQIPEQTAVSIGKTYAEAGSYTAANVSGGLLVSFQEYPLELTVQELSQCILTDAEKESLTDVGIDLSLCNWACVILSDGAERQYLFVLLGDAGVMTADAAEIPVSDNVIDITDKTVYSRTGAYAKATTITVSGAEVVSATEDGTTVNVVLDGSTSADAEISVEFGTSLSNSKMLGTSGSITLADGAATLSMTLTGHYTSMASWKGTAAYTIHFSQAAPPTEVPTRTMESDVKEVYTGIALDIALKDYFSGAKTYYLVEGDTLTELDGKTYTFTAAKGGTHTLTFAAGNVVGMCTDYVTVTVEVKELDSGVWIQHATSNGSLDYVQFTDANGARIDGLSAAYADKVITVTLPQTFDPAGKITATFSRTANSDGYPYLTSKNGFNNAASGKTDIYTTALSNGSGKVTAYLYNSAPRATSNVYDTFTVNYKVFNNVPAFAEGVTGAEEKTLKALKDTYTADLSALFTDRDGQNLTYKVSINDGAYVTCDANYSYSTDLAGTYILKFKANDGQDDSEDTYTVTLTVENSETTYVVPVAVSESVEGLTFYADSLSGQKLVYDSGNVQVPLNVKTIWWKTESGMSGTAAVADGTNLTLQLTTFVVKTALGDEDTGATVTVTDPDGCVISGNGFVYLLDSGEGYTFKAVPGSSYSSGWATNTMNDQTVTTNLEATVEITLAVKNAKTITVDAGAEVKVYYQSAYFVLSEVQPVFHVDHGDTVTYTYSCPNSQTYQKGYLYFAKKDGLIDKAGYMNTVTDATITWDGESRTGTYRGVYDLSTTYGERGDDSVYVNVNNRNHLVLGNGSTFRLRGWRIWEIINSDTENVMIEPEYTYTRYGSDIFTLSNVTDKVSGTGGNNWVELTATGSGVSFLEVGYEAVHIVDGYEAGGTGGAAGQASNFTFNASDPARTALIVVQTDGNNASDVTFGIKNNYGGIWDAEFDTLYFTGSHGELSFTPSATSGIGSVAVSNNKGESFTALTADENGAYTADIVSGSNVIRITNGNGQTAYQVVRGDQVTVAITNTTSGKGADAAIEPGDTVSVSFTGLHAPLGKMSGIYNGNAHQLVYGWNGAKVTMSDYAGYNLPGYAHIEVTVPTEAVDCYTLTGGYISFSSYGSDFGVHRSMTDSGAGQQTMAGKKSGYMSVLPDVEIPVVVPAYTVTLPEGEGYIITASEGSESPVKQGGSYSFTVTVNEGYDGTDMVVKAGDTKLTAVDGVYTIENITADQTVTVDGVEKATPARGDLDGDDSVDAADAALVYSFANGKQEVMGEQMSAADVNGDGKINAADAALIYAYANGKLSSFPADSN